MPLSKLLRHSPYLHPPSSPFSMNFRREESSLLGHNKCYILRLPVELQTQIFTECASQPYGQFMDEYEAPQVFLLVCKYWRDLAYATPSLWSSFDLQFGTWALNFKGPEGDASLLSRMRLWLCRSGSYPLSVKLQYNPPPITRYETLSDFPAEALTLLLQYSSRWRNVELSLPSACFAPLICAIPGLDFPSLDSLVFNPTPFMHSGCLDVRNFTSNCGQLTRLHLNFEAGRVLTLDDCSVIFAQHPNLNSCNLHAQSVFDGSAHAEEKFILPALSDLQLVVYAGSQSSYTSGPSPSSEAASAFTAFLNRLELDVLSSLHIEWSADGDQSRWTPVHLSFVSFLETLAPTLEILSLGYLPLSEDQLIDCLRMVPYLTSAELFFSLGEGSITDRLLRALTLTRTGTGTTALISMLHSLTLQCHGEGCSERELVRFLDSRAEDELHSLQAMRLHTQVPILREESLRSRWTERGIKFIEVYGID